MIAATIYSVNSKYSSKESFSEESADAEHSKAK